VGEIRDEFDREELLTIREVEPGRYQALGRVKVRDFNRQTGWKVPAETADTLAGLVFNTLGRTPRRGESRASRATSSRRRYVWHAHRRWSSSKSAETPSRPECRYGGRDRDVARVAARSRREVAARRAAIQDSAPLHFRRAAYTTGWSFRKRAMCSAPKSWIAA
jgi:hypothetical protein